MTGIRAPSSTTSGTRTSRTPSATQSWPRVGSRRSGGTEACRLSADGMREEPHEARGALRPRQHRRGPSMRGRDLVSIDFFTVPTARLRVLFVFVVLAHDRRRLLH